MRTDVYIHRGSRDAIGAQQTYTDWREVSEEDYNSRQIGDKIKGGQIVVGKKKDGSKFMLQIRYRGP